ncbi:C-type lectin BfL-2-like [Ambystoma mexicanum]|uniref:C-type lectin BfL-2-like n=1 Tax=Ambystoma mexicanum TaxID=8296 RepID=UPI0037E7929F
MKSLVIMLSLLGLGACMKLEVKPEDAVVDNSERGPCSKINASDTTKCPICGIHNWARIGSVCYTVITTPRTFASAEEYCRSTFRGSHLASVHSNVDNSQVFFMLQGLKAFLGGIYLHEGKKFIWTDGSPFNYQNWSPGEPNNYMNVEFCIEMYPTGKWNDVPCTHKQPFICKYNMRRREDQVEEDDQVEAKE